MASHCNKSFAKSYLLLNHEDASFFDLLLLLISPNLAKRNFVDSCSAESYLKESFSQRWLIFISIVAQKLLQHLNMPLKIFGTCVEMLINLVALNDGIMMLIFNTLTGQLVLPDRKSTKYLSCIGYLDARVNLDAVKREDFRYYPALSMMASKASYENETFVKTTIEDTWKMEFVGFYNCRNEYQGKAETQVMIFLDKYEDRHTYVVAFRGTEPFDADDWCTDIDLSWYEIHGVGKIHGGFMKALGLQKNVGWPKQIKQDESDPPFAYYVVRDILRKGLSENENAKFIVTGHSLGGALAILFGTILSLHDEKLLLERLEGIYTFGQPRVGDEAFAKYMKQKFKENSVRYCRFVYCNDIVPRLPYDDKEMMFKHFGTCLFFNSRYELEILEDQWNKNYFSLWCVIPMTFNAVFELIRSFTIAYQKGPQYREGWLLFAFRTIGLLIPGLPAHGPQDYLNSTFLVSIEEHFKVE